ncbi:MAG TPA: FecR domain-containing protein, partial [Verrucomicrobiae bacterium]
MQLIASAACIAGWAATASSQTNDAIRITLLHGRVELSPHGLPQTSPRWLPVTADSKLEAYDLLRTGTNSEVGIQWPDKGFLRFGSLTELEILPADEIHADRGLHLISGLLSFFHRGKPGRIRVITSGAFAGIEGTEFVVEVEPSNGVEQTTLSVIDGKVSFTNAMGGLMLTNGQQAVAHPGAAPVRTAGFIANNILQWCFYYPGVLDTKELPMFSDDEKSSLGASLAEYRAGDLLAALRDCAKQPNSEAGRIYHAALLLSAGQEAEAGAELDQLRSANISEKSEHLAAALRTLIAAVKREPQSQITNPQLATECLAASYYEQSHAIPNSSLVTALALAKKAVAIDPDFGFGWERVAELEFSFGRRDRAAEALDKALSLSPRNAQALALKGFLLAARNDTREAIGWFDRALAVDSALGNAWLGRGLCRFKRGDLQGGRDDLLVAAAMEPQRAGLRSYLAKAWSETGNDRLAMQELHRAMALDPADPTAWLYSALINEDENRLNEAIGDLEKSQQLNTNRSVYRSQLLLDQDRAVRSANLARIYDEAGLDDVALREAGRGVAADYANFSAHLFLANSYAQLLNGSPFDLRYETPATSEYLLASLLGPADGRILAQPVTQQEYTSLFEHDSVGFSSSTEYLSRGALSQYVAQYGTVRDSSYAVEATYNWDPGQAPNNSQDTREISIKSKQMLTPNDGLFVQVLDFNQTSGDLSQYYNPAQADPGLVVNERQDPSVLAGLDHKWSENQHTLLLASSFNDTLSFNDPRGGTYLYDTNSSPLFSPLNLTESFQNRLSLESVELQHLATFSMFQTIAGIRFQDGSYHLSSHQSLLFNNLENNPASDVFSLPQYPATITSQSFRVNSLRLSPYLYEYCHVADPLWLLGGLSYDYQSMPQNALFAPVDDGEKIQKQLSPKGGFVWTPDWSTTVRGLYAQSLEGANLDQSLRLEPTQLAGFTQSYRDLIPASLVGGVGGTR